MKFDLDLSTEYDVINYNKTKSNKYNNFVTQNQRFSTLHITQIHQSGFENDFDFFMKWTLVI